MAFERTKNISIIALVLRNAAWNIEINLYYTKKQIDHGYNKDLTKQLGELKCKQLKS